jgi:salicylate hydroxylase
VFDFSIKFRSGAAIAVEDGVAIARSLQKVKTKDEIPLALSTFEAAQIRRASKMQEAGLLNSKFWHFSDGRIQRARDEAMRPEVEWRPFSHSPNQWSDPATQLWCYG